MNPTPLVANDSLEDTDIKRSNSKRSNSERSNGDERLAIIRRIYFYLVAFVSLVAGSLALDSLLAVVLESWLGTAQGILTTGTVEVSRNTIARSGGQLLIATPIFLIHWAFIRGMVGTRTDGKERDRDEREEAGSAWRKLFLYASVGLGLILASVALYDLISFSAAELLGVEAFWRQAFNWPAGWIHALLMMGVGGSLMLYFVGQAVDDGDLGQEYGWAGTMRRLFQTIVGLAGLGLTIAGASGTLEFLLRAPLSAISQESLLSAGELSWLAGINDRLAALIVGVLIWRISWNRWHDLLDVHEPEGRTALRRTFLYVATVISAAVAVTPAAGLLNDLLRRLFGVATGSELMDLAGPLSLLPVGLIAWRWHWLQVSKEADRYGDTAESANVRRFYFYLVSAVGLVLLWLGLVEISRAVLDWLLIGTNQVGEGFRVEQLANGISLLAVGAPVWAIHWRTVQNVARRMDEDGRKERQSGPRRAYLYGVALVGAIFILFQLAAVLYRLLLWLLGDPSPDLVGSETLDAVVRSGTAAIFWVVHVLALRKDDQYGDKDAMKIAAQAQEIEQDVDAKRAELSARIARLERDLAQARSEMADLYDRTE